MCEGKDEGPQKFHWVTKNKNKNTEYETICRVKSHFSFENKKKIAFLCREPTHRREGGLRTDGAGPPSAVFSWGAEMDKDGE